MDGQTDGRIGEDRDGWIADREDGWIDRWMEREGMDGWRGEPGGAATCQGASIMVYIPGGSPSDPEQNTQALQKHWENPDRDEEKPSVVSGC